MKRLFQLFFLGGCLLLPCLGASTDLITVYEDAMHTAPSLQAAANRKLAADQDFRVAGSVFLPQLNFQSAVQRNQAETADRYRSSQFDLKLTQIVFNREAWYVAKTKGLNALVAKYDHQVLMRNFIYLVALSYTTVLQAKQGQKVATAHFVELKNFYEQVQRRYEVGLSSAVDLAKSKAGMDEAYAYQVAQDNAVLIAEERLAYVSGKYYIEYKDFSKDYFVEMPEPNDLDVWKAKAFLSNEEIREKILMRDIQKEVINVTRSEFIPTIALFASNVNYNSNLNGQFGDHGHLRDQVVGVQFVWTLFNGGDFSYNVAQQKDVLLYRDLDLMFKRKQIVESLQTDWFHLQSALGQQKAYQHAIEASEAALKSYQSQFDAGTVTMVDVLQKIQDYYKAQSYYYGAQYQAILAWVSFKNNVGILSKEDLILLNKQLTDQKS